MLKRVWCTVVKTDLIMLCRSYASEWIYWINLFIFLTVLIIFDYETIHSSVMWFKSFIVVSRNDSKQDVTVSKKTKNNDIIDCSSNFSCLILSWKSYHPHIYLHHHYFIWGQEASRAEVNSVLQPWSVDSFFKNHRIV